MRLCKDYLQRHQSDCELITTNNLLSFYYLSLLLQRLNPFWPSTGPLLQHTSPVALDCSSSVQTDRPSLSDSSNLWGKHGGASPTRPLSSYRGLVGSMTRHPRDLRDKWHCHWVNGCEISACFASVLHPIYSSGDIPLNSCVLLSLEHLVCHCELASVSCHHQMRSRSPLLSRVTINTPIYKTPSCRTPRLKTTTRSSRGVMVKSISAP